MLNFKMKNMKKINIALVVVASVLLSSCGDILDKEPLNSRNESVFYKTEQDMFEAVISIYDAAQLTSAHQVTADILSDDGYAGGSSRNDIPEQIQLDNHQILATNYIAEEIWDFNYTGIYRANIVLEKLPEIENADAATLARFEAEAKFFRAYFNWNLVRFFENIPLVTKTLSPSEYGLPQAPPSDVYSQIFTDIVESIDGLPTEMQADGRVTKWAAQALLARIWMFHDGVYGNSVSVNGTNIDGAYIRTALDDIVDNSQHTLMPDVTTIFTRAGEMSSESVFELQYSDLAAYGDWGWPYGGEGNFPVVWQGPRVKDPAQEEYFRGWSFNTVTKALYDEFDDADPRKDAYIISQDDFATDITKGFQHTGYFTNKYTTKKEYQATDGSPELNYGNNYKVIRFADVLLMAAEMHVITGGSRAQEHLDKVRERVGMPTIEPTLDNIYKERRLELCMEGLRYHDLLRRGLDVAEANITVSGNYGEFFDYKESEESDFDITFNPATKGFLPIPQNEIDLLNGIYNQNAGY
jgi:hypothetical protein